jgi:sugar phosphate permease
VRKRGLDIGIAFSGVGVGSILMLPWIQTVIMRTGWRTACYATAALVLLTLLPLNGLQRRQPQDLGLRPDGDAEPPADTGRGHPANVVDPAWASIEWTLARAVRTARFWWILVGFFGGLFAWYAVQVYQKKYLIEIGFAPRWRSSIRGQVPLTGRRKNLQG